MNRRPLEHKRILLTRSNQHVDALNQSLCSRGAIAVPFPCLQVEILSEDFKTVINSISDYSDVVFTSTNGVDAVAKQGIGLATLLQGKRIAAVGEKTAAALMEHGVHADIVPKIASQDGLLAAYTRDGLPRTLLFFRAEEGSDRLTGALALQGVAVTMVLVYRTVCPSSDASDVINQLHNNEIDAVLLGSPKTAAFYIERIGSIALADRPVVVVISESLAMAVRSMGLSVQVVAKHASFEAMLDALAEYFDTPPS